MKVKPTRMFTPEEAAIAIEEASARGLPNGWTVHWDNKKRCRIWVSPCGRRKCDGIPEALAVSVKMGLLEANKMPPAYRDKMFQNRVLSREEAEHSLKEARARGLPNGWTVEYNNKHRGKLWISPEGKKCTSIPQAIAIAKKMGMNVTQKESYIIPKRDLDPKERFLTPNEVETAMKKARDRGLPEGWTVEYNTNNKGKIWISPDGRRRCDSIPKAIAMSVKLGLLPPEATPLAYQKRTRNTKLSHEEAALLLKKAGLPVGWKVEWDNVRNQRVWMSPDGRKCYGIPQALALVEKRKKRMSTAKAKAFALTNLNPFTPQSHATKQKETNSLSYSGIEDSGSAIDVVVRAVQRHKRVRDLSSEEELEKISCYFMQKKKVKEANTILQLQYS